MSTTRLYYLRDPNCGEEQRKAFEAASAQPECIQSVDNSGPTEGNGDVELVNGDRCPVGLGAVVLERYKVLARKNYTYTWGTEDTVNSWRVEIILKREDGPASPPLPRRTIRSRRN